jgi:hypothetical protein
VLDQHAARVAYSIDLVSGANTIPARALDNALVAHIVLAILGFGFLLPAGGVVAYCHRRHSTRKTWFVAHRGLQTLGGVAGMASWCVACRRCCC